MVDSDDDEKNDRKMTDCNDKMKKGDTNSKRNHEMKKKIKFQTKQNLCGSFTTSIIIIY